jgi:hypothetical protein
MASGYRALVELRDQGVIKGFGAGINDWRPASGCSSGDFDIFLLAGRYTLLEQEALESFLPLCTSAASGIVIGGPYNSGILATGPRPGAFYNYDPAPQAILDRVARIEAVCAAHGTRMVDAAFQFPLRHPAVVSVIPGGQSVAEVHGNLAAARATIPPALWADLKAEGLLRPDAPVGETDAPDRRPPALLAPRARRLRLDAEGRPVLARPYGPADLAPQLAAHDITHTVLVQAAATVDETEYMLGIADATPHVAAVVGWIDFEKPSDLAHLKRLAQHPKFAGVRPMIQDIPDDDWMLRDDVQWAFRAVSDLGLTFDALGFPRHLANFHTILTRYPDLRVVVDHCMKPQIRDHSEAASATGPTASPASPRRARTASSRRS